MREVGAGIAVVLVCAGLLLFPPQPFINVERRIFDSYAQWAGRGKPSRRVVIVEVDEASLSRFGRWPWPRERIARLVKRLLDDGAETVAVDMVFAEPDSTDDALAAAIQGRKVVIGYHFGFGPPARQEVDCVLHPSVLLDAGLPSRGLFRASTALCNRPVLAKAAAATGFLNATPDPDGVLRRIPLLLAYRGAVYPSLALATVLTHGGASSVTLRDKPSQALLMTANQREIPLDGSGGLLLRFRGPANTFSSISAGDVLSGRAADAVRGKLAIVGGAARGLQDIVSAPVAALFPGLEAQATAIDNLLQGDFLNVPPGARIIELLLVVGAGLGSAFLASKTRYSWAAASLGVGGVCLWLGTFQYFAATRAFVSPWAASLSMGANLAVFTGLSLRKERLRAEEATRRLAANREFVVHALASLAAIRDLETGEHLLRTQHYTRLLCDTLASHPRHRAYLTRDSIDLLVQLVPLHDIGKVGVPDYVLQKPGRLTPEEFEIVKRHVEHGREVLERARIRSGSQDQHLLRVAEEIVYTHHERWDGSGYPRKLRGEEIPFPGRVMALVDVYDALVSKRVYKQRMPHSEAMALIAAGSGKHFDPDLVAAFLESHESFQKVAQEFDEGQASAAAP